MTYIQFSTTFFFFSRLDIYDSAGFFGIVANFNFLISYEKGPVSWVCT